MDTDPKLLIMFAAPRKVFNCENVAGYDQGCCITNAMATCVNVS